MTQRFLGILSLATLLGPAPLAAQTADPKAAPRGMSVTVHATESWESDPIFDSTLDPSSFVTRLGVGIGYVGGSPRGKLLVEADGGGVFYHEVQGYDSYYYGGVLTGEHRFSPKTTLSVAETLTNDYARRSNLLVSSGLLYPLVRTLTNQTAVGLSHDFSARTHLDTRVGFDYVKFLSGDFVDGHQIRAGVSLSRSYKKRITSFGVAYDFNRSATPAQPDQPGLNQDYHSASLVGSAGIGRNGLATGRFGATAFRKPGGGFTATPTGSADFSVHHPRSRFAATLRYERAVSQAFGLGVERIADVVGITLTQPLGRKTSYAVGYGYSLSQETSAAVVPFHFATQNAYGGFRYAATRSLSMDLGYTYFQSGYYTPPLKNHVALLGLAYRRDPR